MIVTPKTPENAMRLLANAQALGLSPDVVRTTSTGFDVPDEVANYQPKQTPAPRKSTRTKSKE